MRSISIAMFSLLVGCGGTGDDTVLAGQRAAVDIIWRVTYQQTKAPPQILWRWDHCNEPNGIYAPLPWCTFDSSHGQVVGLQGDGWIEVGGPWATGLMSDTALAHELLHSVIGDAEHTLPQWQYVDPLNATLRASGL